MSLHGGHGWGGVWGLGVASQKRRKVRELPGDRGIEEEDYVWVMSLSSTQQGGESLGQRALKGHSSVGSCNCMGPSSKSVTAVK